MRNKLFTGILVPALAAALAASVFSCSKPAGEAPESVAPWDKQAMSTYLFLRGSDGIDSNFISKVDFENFDNVYFINYERWDSEAACDSIFEEVLAHGGAAFPISNPAALRYGIDEAHKAGTKALITSCSEIEYGACDPARRAKLVKSLIELVKEYDADGIDIDWEANLYPNLDKHTALMEELRASLDSLGEVNNRKYYLTTALSIECQYFPEELRERMGKAVDWVNLMAYDTGGGIWDKTARHNTPAQLYADSIDNNWKTVPREKLHLGLASYGFKYDNLLPYETIPDDKEMTDYGYYISYNEAVPFIYNNRAWRAEFDPVEKCYYFINDAAKSFITIDTPETLIYKYQLAADKGLGGTFWWEYSKDIVPDKTGGDKWVHTLIPNHIRKESYK